MSFKDSAIFKCIEAKSTLMFASFSDYYKEHGNVVLTVMKEEASANLIFIKTSDLKHLPSYCEQTILQCKSLLKKYDPTKEFVFALFSRNGDGGAAIITPEKKAPKKLEEMDEDEMIEHVCEQEYLKTPQKAPPKRSCWNPVCKQFYIDKKDKFKHVCPRCEIAEYCCEQCMGTDARHAQNCFNEYDVE